MPHLRNVTIHYQFNTLNLFIWFKVLSSVSQNCLRFMYTYCCIMWLHFKAKAVQLEIYNMLFEKEENWNYHSKNQCTLEVKGMSFSE